jgi:hypothetical protein
MTDVEIINGWLSDTYRTTVENYPVYRIVWSEDIFENRLGTYREFTESGLFIREVTEVRKVRKYGYIHHRWIFEIWAPGNLTRNPETPDAASGDYIPVYVFESGLGMYLPVTRKVVEFLISALEGKIKRDLEPTEEYLAEKEVAAMVESLDDHPSYFQTRAGPARNAIWFKGFDPQKIEGDK